MSQIPSQSQFSPQPQIRLLLSLFLMIMKHFHYLKRKMAAKKRRGGRERRGQGPEREKRRQQRKRKKTARESVSMDEDTPPPPPPPPVTENSRRISNYTIATTDRMLLVAFGSAMFGKDGVRIKGHRHGVTDLIFKQLKHRESLGELCLLTIDEYFTSQVCNNCKERNLEHVENNDGKNLHAALRCKTCEGLIWNRDMMASKNMWDISWSIWREEGRPDEFKPLTQQQHQPEEPPTHIQDPQLQSQ